MGATAAVVFLAACNDDGRTLVPPSSGQNASVSTPSTAPVVTDGVSGQVVETTAPEVTVADLTSPALIAPWTEGTSIPARYTCDGPNIAPALSWSGAPATTVEIAVTLTDLQAPGFVHWAMSGIDPQSTTLAESVVPEFAITSTNSAGADGYTGPCPPANEIHRYELTVHFLSQQTELASGGPAADLLAFIDGATLASASVTGSFSRLG